jgi:hypothetical protein
VGQCGEGVRPPTVSTHQHTIAGRWARGGGGCIEQGVMCSLHSSTGLCSVCSAANHTTARCWGRG